MAKNKVEEEVSIEVEASAPTKIFVSAPRMKVYSFAQWAQLRNKQERHLGGLRAFLGALVVNKYPLDKWDEMMKAY